MNEKDLPPLEELAFQELFETWIFFIEKALWAIEQGLRDETDYREIARNAEEWFNLGDRVLQGARFTD